MNLSSLLTLVGVILSAIGLAYVARGSIKKDREATAQRYEKAQEKAVRDATEPLARDLVTMTDDRNDWRAQARVKDERIQALTDQITQLLREARP